MIWRQALHPDPTTPVPVGHGWHLFIERMSQSATPGVLMVAVKQFVQHVYVYGSV